MAFAYLLLEAGDYLLLTDDASRIILEESAEDADTDVTIGLLTASITKGALVRSIVKGALTIEPEM